MRLIIEYPKLLPDALQQTQEEFEREAKMAMAVKLFELGKIFIIYESNYIQKNRFLNTYYRRVGADDIGQIYQRKLE